MDKMNPNAVARNRTEDDEALDGPAISARAGSRVDESRRRRFILTEAVRAEVIPRLLAHRGAPPRDGVRVSETQIFELADLALNTGDDAAAAYVTELVEAGYPAEALYLDLLSPAAALLGQYWVDDLCNFADVTIGMVQLQQAMRALGPAFFGSHTLLAPVGPRALLLPLPGEQHTFGLSMLADFFRRAGWNTWSGMVAKASQLHRMVADDQVDLVGFSLACDEMIDVARREIAAVRAASRNKRLVVMVGGPPFLTDFTLADRIGADGTAKDGLQAVITAERLIPRSAGRA